MSLCGNKTHAYHAHSLTTELYDRTMRVLNGLHDQVTTKLKLLLGGCSSQYRMTLAANFL